MGTRQVMAALGALLLGGCASAPDTLPVTPAQAGVAQVAASTSDDGLRVTLSPGVQEVRTGQEYSHGPDLRLPRPGDWDDRGGRLG